MTTLLFLLTLTLVPLLTGLAMVVLEWAMEEERRR